MKISIKGGGGGKGWSNYVTRKYVKLTPKEREKITWLGGDSDLGDKTIKSSNYNHNSYTLVLAFDGKIGKDKARAVNEDFRKLFMHGFEDDEYSFESVLHQDTSNDHIHIRIPKKNLLTDTQLRLYLDKKDRKRLNAIRDYLILKHDLPQPKQEVKSVIQNNSKKEQLIQRQRKEQGRNPFDFSKKKGREEAKSYINNYIVECHELGLIGSFEDLKSLIESTGLKIANTGQDYTGDFHYITVQDKESGKKIRLQGELYNAEFWELQREDRTAKIRDNKVPHGTDEGLKGGIEGAKKRLDTILKKRLEEVTKRYKTGRTKARAERAELLHIQTGNDSDSNSIRVVHSRSIGNEVSSSGQVELHNISNRGVIDDRSRRILGARTRERESILSTVRERTKKPRESLYTEFREHRESLYSQARRVVSERGRTRANRKRDYKAVKQIVARVEEVRGTSEQQGNGRIRELIESFGTRFDGEITRTFGNHHEQSSNFGQEIESAARAVEEVIEERDEDIGIGWSP